VNKTQPEELKEHERERDFFAPSATHSGFSHIVLP
jgi:hypothetical protein